MPEGHTHAGDTEGGSPIDWAVCLALAGVFAWLCAAAGRETEHVAALNDFWGNAFAAEHLAWNARALWNGFFPPGYPAVLAMLPGSRLVESAFTFNVAAGTVLLVVVWRFARGVAGMATACAAMAVVACNPTVVDQILTTGADAGMVTLAVGGALLLFTAIRRPAETRGSAVAAGVLLGAAGWFRYHAFVFAAAALVAAALVGRRPAWRRVGLAAAVVATWGLCLVAVGVAAGDVQALGRAQAFNVYKGLVGPVDWFHLDASALPATIADAIARDPDAFMRGYLAFSTPHVWLLVPLAIGALIAVGVARTFVLFTLATTLVFVPIVNLGASPRGIACVVPLVLVAAVLAAASATTRIAAPRARRLLRAALGLSTALAVWQAWIPQIAARVDGARAMSWAYQAIGARLRADHVALGTEVFTDSAFYFLDAPGWRVAAYHPRVLGGWPALDLAGYLEAYPQPGTETLEAFLDDCRRMGVTHLLLTSAAGAVHPDLGRLFEGRHTSNRLHEVPALPGVRIFRLIG